MPITQERVFVLLSEIKAHKERLQQILDAVQDYEMVNGPTRLGYEIKPLAGAIDTPGYHAERAHFTRNAQRNARVAGKRRLLSGSEIMRPLLGLTGLEKPERALAQQNNVELTKEAVTIARAVKDVLLEEKVPDYDEKLYDQIKDEHPEWDAVKLLAECKRRQERDKPITGSMF